MSLQDESSSKHNIIKGWCHLLLNVPWDSFGGWTVLGGDNMQYPPSVWLSEGMTPGIYLHLNFPHWHSRTFHVPTNLCTYRNMLTNVLSLSSNVSEPCIYIYHMQYVLVLCLPPSHYQLSTHPDIGTSLLYSESYICRFATQKRSPTPHTRSIDGHSEYR